MDSNAVVSNLDYNKFNAVFQYQHTRDIIFHHKKIAINKDFIKFYNETLLKNILTKRQLVDELFCKTSNYNKDELTKNILYLKTFNVLYWAMEDCLGLNYPSVFKHRQDTSGSRIFDRYAWDNLYILSEKKRKNIYHEAFIRKRHHLPVKQIKKRITELEKLAL